MSHASDFRAGRLGGGRLCNAVQKAYAERVAAGLIKPQEESERKPLVVLISTNGGRLIEADRIKEAPPPPKRKAPQPKRRRVAKAARKTKRKGEIYPKLSWIIEATARCFELSVEDILGMSREELVCRPRQVAMYLARDLTTHSTTEVARTLGRSDHTTVLHGVDVIKRRMAMEPELAEKVGTIRQIILAGMYVGGNDNGGAMTSPAPHTDSGREASAARQDMERAG